MSSHERQIPEWAVPEREQDLTWIRENMHVILPAAKLAFEASGRGAVIVDTNTVVTEGERSGNPMFYLPAQQIEQNAWLPAIKMVREYDPSWECASRSALWQSEGHREVEVRLLSPLRQ